jgi:hypothetical protein
MKLTIDPRIVAQQRARARIAQDFNNRALQNLHADMLALSRGEETTIAAREAERLDILQRIDDATSIDEVDDILMELGA